jgi:hypothetical protein
MHDDANKDDQVWTIPAGGGEIVQVTNSPSDIKSFQ